MKKFISEIFLGLKSLYVGMRVTITEFFKPTVTVHYPHQTLKIPPRFRGHIELVKDPSTGRAICYACKLCERACPSDCITVEGAKLEGAKKRSVSKYILDFTKCSLCGSCVEACNDGAIQFSREYNLAGWKKEDYIMDLFKRLEDQAKNSGGEAPAPAEPAQASPAPAAEKAPAAPKVEETAKPESGEARAAMVCQPAPSAA